MRHGDDHRRHLDLVSRSHGDRRRPTELAASKALVASGHKGSRVDGRKSLSGWRLEKALISSTHGRLGSWRAKQPLMERKDPRS